MPFAGQLFTKGEVLTELKRICNNNDQQVTKLWDKVVERFNNATKAKDFIKALDAAGQRFAAAWEILLYYDGKLSDITLANASAAASRAHQLAHKATQEIPGFFAALVQRTDKHRAGTYNPDSSRAKSRQEASSIIGAIPTLNGSFLQEKRLYIEWYVGGSAAKRFFTAFGKSDVWFTEGGTHGISDFWHNPNPTLSPNAWTRCFKAEG